MVCIFFFFGFLFCYFGFFKEKKSFHRSIFFFGHVEFWNQLTSGRIVFWVGGWDRRITGQAHICEWSQKAVVAHWKAVMQGIKVLGDDCIHCSLTRWSFYTWAGCVCVFVSPCLHRVKPVTSQPSKARPLFMLFFKHVRHWSELKPRINSQRPRKHFSFVRLMGWSALWLRSGRPVRVGLAPPTPKRLSGFRKPSKKKRPQGRVKGGFPFFFSQTLTVLVGSSWRIAS